MHTTARIVEGKFAVCMKLSQSWIPECALPESAEPRPACIASSVGPSWAYVKLITNYNRVAFSNTNRKLIDAAKLVSPRF